MTPQEVLDLCEAGPAGEWQCRIRPGTSVVFCGEETIAVMDRGLAAMLLAAAHNDIPAMLRRVIELEARVKELEDWVEDAKNDAWERGTYD